MATNIDKALFQSPQGLESEADGMEGIEIEIIDPEEVNIHAGDLEISIEPGEPSIDNFDANLAEFLPESFITTLASELSCDIDNDRNSRKDWEKAYVAGLKLLGLQIEERTEPWNGASGVFHPMITEAVVRFQSATITETFPAQGPVRTKIIGKETPDKRAAATRVEEDMNFQLTEVMQEFRPEHERMLWSLPATGSAFKKVYFDPSLGRQTSVFIPAEDILLPYGASNLETAERVTHVMRKTENDVTKLIEAGFYRDVTLPEPSYQLDDIEKQKAEEMGMSAIDDARYRILEMHVNCDLKGYEDKDKKGRMTGIALPYVVTIEKNSRQVLAIRRNWYEDDVLHTQAAALCSLPIYSGVWFLWLWPYPSHRWLRQERDDAYPPAC